MLKRIKRKEGKFMEIRKHNANLYNAADSENEMNYASSGCSCSCSCSCSCYCTCAAISEEE